MGRVVEVESLAQLDELLAAGATSMRGWRLQDLDLTGRTFEGLAPAGALFLGCVLDPAVEESLRAQGALIFPTVPDLPFDAYRGQLYTPDELYAGLADGYAGTMDARVYAWSRQAEQDVAFTLAQALHDHAVDDALGELAAGREIVGVMGGHAVERGTPAYAEAARLGRSLTRAGLLVSTGGGPGAMEAANLGAYLGPHDDSVLDDALGVLSMAPSFRPTVDAWARAAFEVRRRWPGGESLGIPTWFYGHEPPNAFASHVAKYFRNAIREDTLLRICTAGVVFLPGAGGTVQEVFQDACENYYAEPGTVAPMVLVGGEFWTSTLPAWPLLTRLAEGRPMAPSVALVDSLQEAVTFVTTPR